MKSYAYTDGLAAVAACIAVVAASFLFTGMSGNRSDVSSSQETWSEPFAALAANPDRSDG